MMARRSANARFLSEARGFASNAGFAAVSRGVKRGILASWRRASNAARELLGLAGSLRMRQP
jgi:hypothetical protein